MSEITNNPSVPSQIVEKVTFPQFINQLGIIPTSYKDSMDYYETLAWLCKYLEETVIPTVNQNGEAVEELQGLYIELKDYVDNYFENLNVQQEINNKLDEMTEDGTLTNLIKNYVDPIYQAYENEINSTVDTQNNKINVLESRVDEITELPEGSTSGDAELADIRIGFNGQTYANAGNAVRGQTETNFNDINNRFNKLIENKIITQLTNSCVLGRSLISSSQLVYDSTQTGFCTTQFIEVPYAKKIKFKIRSGYKYIIWKSAYNEYGHNALQITSGYVTTDTEYTYNSTYKYLCATVTTNGGSTLQLSEIAKVFTIEVENINNIPNINNEITTLTNDINNRFNALDNNIILTNESVTMSYGRVYRDPQTNFMTLDPNDKAVAYSGFITLTPLKKYKITPKKGYKAFAWYSAHDDFGYGGSNITQNYTTESFEYTPTNIYKYIIIIIKRTNDSYLIEGEFENGIILQAENSIENLENANVHQVPLGGQIVYTGDTSSESGYICNAISLKNGTIIACRSNGKVIKIDLEGNETELASFSGSNFDFRLLYEDSNGNIYISPHASLGSMTSTDNGLYRMAKNSSSFTKVISLYNPSSDIPTEAENNDDTIWTMCEDDSGNLYAGVYAHTVHNNPAIYKSTNGGTTWTYLYNFRTSGLTPTGKHIHSIIYSKWKKALYCIVGEVNTIFKSTDGGSSWINLNITLSAKGTTMLPTEYGIFIGSDGAYNCEIDLLKNDDITHINIYKGWANTVFALRKSDITGFIYAFCKIDSSVGVSRYYPPTTAISDESALETWIESEPTYYSQWLDYYNSVKDIYPEDAIRPQHHAILISRDGLNFEPLYIVEDSATNQPDGFWCTGYFKNGECLTGQIKNRTTVNPVIISEGKHKYTEDGIDLLGEIMIKTNSSNYVTDLM